MLKVENYDTYKVATVAITLVAQAMTTARSQIIGIPMNSWNYRDYSMCNNTDIKLNSSL